MLPEPGLLDSLRYRGGGARASHLCEIRRLRGVCVVQHACIMIARPRPRLCPFPPTSKPSELRRRRLSSPPRSANRFSRSYRHADCVRHCGPAGTLGSSSRAACRSRGGADATASKSMRRRADGSPQPSSVGSRRGCVCVGGSLLLLLVLLLLWEEEILERRVEEDTDDGDGGADLGLEGHDFAEDNRRDHHHDHALGRIGNRRGDGARLLDRHRRELVVQVEGHAGGEQVVREDGVCGRHVDELVEVGALQVEHQRERDEETKHLRHRELVADAADALLELRVGGEELGVLVALDGGEEVRDRGHDERGHVDLDHVREKAALLHALHLHLGCARRERLE
mmetsp:Transcript_37883/g.100188  ORF Transcript_37883/g.100188 Transcript_37883/m.100188 type:complete len:340 (-) Transcript_37883:539-1558(-)